MAVGLTALAAAALAVWLYLLFGHGGFWRADQRLDAPGGTLDASNASSSPSPRTTSGLISAREQSLSKKKRQKRGRNFAALLIVFPSKPS